MGAPLIRAVWALSLALLVSRCTAETSPSLIEIGTANFTDSLNSMNEYDWLLLEFYAHWCPACKAFQPKYKEIADHVAARGTATPQIAVARIDCPDNQDLCSDFDVNSYPSMWLGKPKQFLDRSNKELIKINPRVRTKDGVIAEMAKQLGVSLEIGKEPSKREEVNADSQNGGADAGQGGSNNLRIVKPLAPRADLNDIEGAMLKSWEYLTAPAMLKGSETRQALEIWLNLLMEAHPMERCRLGAQKASVVLATAWPAGTEDAAMPAALREVQICGKSEFEDWKGCKGSIPSGRGYTCGLWQLFHALSAGLPEEDDKSGSRWLVAVRGFVKHFFQCSDCSRNFVSYASSESAEKVVTKKEAVLWMWSTHNLVNKRLKKEEEEASTGDPLFPKVQWPPVSVCSPCHGGSSSNKEWDEGALYAFLLQYYHSGAAGKGQVAAAVGEVKPVKVRGFGSSWSMALMVCSGVGIGAYSVLRTSGQYAFKKAISRKM